MHSQRHHIRHNAAMADTVDRLFDLTNQHSRRDVAQRLRAAGAPLDLIWRLLCAANARRRPPAALETA